MTKPDAAAGVPLVARALTDVLFHSAERVFTTTDFLRDAYRLAGELPETVYLFNLCQDRYWFTVSLAAAVMREQVCLLTSDQSAARLQGLAKQFGNAGIITDNPAFAGTLPSHCIDPSYAGNPEEDLGCGPEIPAERLAAIVFTSGSTGEPVGSWKSWGLLTERSITAGQRFSMMATAPASVVGMVPPRHMYGFETTCLLPLHTACGSWCGPLFYPSDVRAALASVLAPRVLITTPLQLRALLQAEQGLPELACVISATAPLDPKMAAAAESRWNTQVFEIFGATELGSIASRRTVKEDSWTTYDGIRLESSDGETVRVTAPQAAPGTMSDTVEVLDPTRFRLIGRSNDIIKLGGRRASLSGLNRILTDIPGVRDGVFVAPDDMDSRPTARMQAFVIAPDHSAEGILAALRDRIDSVFLPRRVIQVTTLPRNELGKLPREALLAIRDQKEDGG